MTDLAITNDGQLRPQGLDAHGRLIHAAQQFEAAFVQMLFQVQDQAEQDDPPLMGGSSADTQFKELFRTGLSERAAGHLGISQLLERQLEPHAQLHAQPQAQHQSPATTPGPHQP
jgi:Rod binding domain-containing protein